MLFLPVADPLGVLLIPEIILVLRLGQPSPLRLADGPCDTRVLSNSTGVAHSDNRQEKVPCSSGTCVGLSAASWVPKSKGTIIGNRCEEAEENPPGRRLRTAKKEEEFSENPAKKIQRKKIPFQIGSFASIPSRRRHAPLCQRSERLYKCPRSSHARKDSAIAVVELSRLEKFRGWISPCG